MVTLIKGNAEMRVPDEDVTAYLRKGYAVVDAHGNVMQTAKVYSYDELLVLNRSHERTIHRQTLALEEKDAEIARLSAALAKAEASKAPETHAEPPKTSATSESEGGQANDQPAKKPATKAQKQ